MRDSDQDRNLQRGDQIHIDCSTSERISAVSYQQTAKADVPPHRKKGRKLEISCHFPATQTFGAATVQASCATEAGDTATFSAALEAHPGPLSTSASINKPGSTSTQIELTGRTYTLLLRRFLQSKLQCGSTHNSTSTKYTSSAERDERHSPQQCDRLKVQIERKARSHWITCMCTQEASGCQVGIKAKASSGKRKFTDHQKWHVSFNASVHLGSPVGLKPRVKAEMSTPF
ncbi:hypothetical protein WJX79_009505 [Trebouxia sp. C0005]